MFNVMVIARDHYWEEGAATWDRSRIFEHTADGLKDRFRGLTPQDLQTLSSLPTLFMYERGVEGRPRVGFLKKIQRRGPEVRIVYEFDETVAPLTSDRIEEIKIELQLSNPEFTRSHWALKDGDLYEVLRENGLVDVAPPADEPGARIEVRANKVFLVHGRDEGAKQTVARFLENKVKISVVVLAERPNRGRHLLTKFEEEADGADYAIVLMTGDDVGRLRPGLLAHGRPEPAEELRARQNVIFELGYLLAKFGNDRVCVLHADGVEKPSDYDGIVYVPFDDQEGWQKKLVTELHAADVPVAQEWWRNDTE